MIDTLVEIEVPPGVVMESQSGLQNSRPRIYARLRGPGQGGGPACLLMHPTSNFFGHYLLAPLAGRGLTVMALNSRYVGNDMLLSMERVLSDLGAGVRLLRARGHDPIVLLGNSGGAALMAYYQAEAERGAPGLAPADGIVLTAAHAGRARLLAEWLDPAVTDEADPLATDPDLDLYAPGRSLPFDPDFLTRFRAAQRARYLRLDAWVRDRLSVLARTPGAPDDQPFILHRTHADPRFLDRSLDANDRAVGSVWGDPRVVNLAANAMGRLTSLRSWQSQWGTQSRADGPGNLARTSVPVLLHIHTADQSTFPSTHRLWQDAAGTRLTRRDIPLGTHYLQGQPSLVALSADSIADWIAAKIA